MLENKYKTDLVKRIENTWVGSIVIRVDPTFIQGFPDLLVLYNDRWAALEVKKSSKEPHRPNQDDYVELTNQMGFGAFIFPENEDDVLAQLDDYFFG